MTAEERAQSGLSKLTRKELDFLNSWLSLHLRPTDNGSADYSIERTRSEEFIETEVQRRLADKLAIEAASAERAKKSRTYSAIVIGGFSGWQGKTLFRLDNGEIWRQKSNSKYRYRGSDARVRLTQNWAGGWEMEVASTGKRVLVKRVR